MFLKSKALAIAAAAAALLSSAGVATTWTANAATPVSTGISTRDLGVEVTLDGAPAPAFAPARTTFVITVNGGADVTRQPLTVHQVITCGGTAYTVQSVRGSFGTYEIKLTPHLAATAVCST